MISDELVGRLGGDRVTDEDKMQVRVGYIGLGDMGAPMAASIIKAGFDLTVFDLRDDAMATLEKLGARRATSVGALAKVVDVLCTCVLYEDQVKDIFLGDDGIIANAPAGLVAAIHSTVYPETVLAIAEAARGSGVLVIDAPVSGGSERARTGCLTLMVGSSDEAFRKAAPVFDTIGRHIFRVGDVGTGQAVKLGNNIMSLINQLVAMEAVRFVSAYGVKASVLFEVAQVSSGASHAVENWSKGDRYGVEHTLAGTPELPHRLAKDLRYALAAAQERWTNLPILALCSQLLPGMFRDRWSDPECWSE